MQTTGIPPSHPVSPRNTTNNSAATNAFAAERFSEAMHRALGGADSRSHQQSNHHSAAEESARKDKTDSHDDVKTDKKHKAKRNSEHAVSQFLGMAAPSASPQLSPSQPKGGTENSEGAAGSFPTTTEATDSSPSSPRGAEESQGEVEPGEQGQPESANPSEATEAQAPTATGESSSKINSTLPPHSEELNSDPANPAEAKVETGAESPNSPQIDPKTPLAQAGAPPPDARGTSAAKQDMTMKKAEKTQKVAGPAEQDLPGMTSGGSEEVPQGQKLSAKEAVHGSQKLENAAIELPVRVLTSSDSPAPTATVAAPAAATPLDARILERTHDIVALHAMRLGEYTSDSLHVVVKPGAGIQLSLELRQSARGIEVQASLHKGDFAQLNQHWSELQQRLEARGVRVGALTTPENFSGTGNQQFQQSKQQAPNQDPLYAGAFAEFALAGSVNEAPAARAARATAYRGWETWA